MKIGGNGNVAAPLTETRVPEAATGKLGRAKQALAEPFHKLADVATKRVTPEKLINTQEAFTKNFRAELGKMTEGMPPAAAQHYERMGEVALKNILSKTFDRSAQQLINGDRVSDLRSNAREAGKLAQSFRDSIRTETLTARADVLRERIGARGPEEVVTPRLMARGDGTFNLVTSPVKIENLVLKGGGGKGIGYPPALAEMQRAGEFSGLKQVVGTSAGALTAVAVASGLSPEELKALGSQDIGKLLETDKKVGKLYPEISFKHQVEVAGGSAQGMVRMLDQTCGQKVADHLNAVADRSPMALADFAARYAEQTGGSKEAVLARITTLMEPDFGSVRSGKMVTFGDMKMMHSLAPETFKEIRLTGYDKNDKATKYFSADSTPDVPVAFAARISMAHPAIASAVKLDPKFGLGNHVFADGGILTNSPTEALYDGDLSKVTGDNQGHDAKAIDIGQARARTMLMIFDEKGKGYTSLHGAPEDRTSSANWISRRFGQTTETKMADKAKEYAGQTHIVFHGKAGTMTTSPTREEVALAEAQSSFETLSQIDLRSRQPLMQEVGTVQQAFGLLSDADRQLVLDAGPPRAGDFPRAQDFEAASTLYGLCQTWDALR